MTIAVLDEAGFSHDGETVVLWFLMGHLCCGEGITLVINHEL
jgi:hypothetical protein